MEGLKCKLKSLGFISCGKPMKSEDNAVRYITIVFDRIHS